MSDKEKKKKKEDDIGALIRKLIILGGAVFVFSSILLGFKLLGFFDLLK